MLQTDLYHEAIVNIKIFRKNGNSHSNHFQNVYDETRIEYLGELLEPYRVY